MKPCIEPGCDRSAVAQSLCRLHYERGRKSGKVVIVKPQIGRRICRIDGCEKFVRAHSLCGMHNTRLLKNGDPLKVRKIAKNPDGALCLVEGCGGKIKALGYCNKHYLRYKNHGDPLGGAAFVLVNKAIDHSDGTRTCAECRMRKVLVDDFHVDKNGSLGHRARCKKCHTAHSTNWYSANQDRQMRRARKIRARDSEEIKVRDNARYVKDREKRIELATEHSQRRRARKAKTVVEKGISRLALRKIHGDLCHYCGITMIFTRAIGRIFKPEHATIEHLIPLAKGGEHTFANCILACRGCNISKNAKTLEQWKNGLD